MTMNADIGGGAALRRGRRGAEWARRSAAAAAARGAAGGQNTCITAIFLDEQVVCRSTNTCNRLLTNAFLTPALAALWHGVDAKFAGTTSVRLLHARLP